MSDRSDDALREAYRSPEPDGARAPVAGHVFHYFPEAEPQRNSVAAVYGLLTPLFVFTFVAIVSGSPWLGLLAASAVVGWSFWKRRRQKLVPRVTFRVEGPLLHLSGPAFPSGHSFELRELLEVYLDTKTIRRVQESPGPVPDLRFIDATVGGEQDTSRIALELAHETLFLTDEHLSHLDASEWFGKLRRFLRKHGWLPEDERPRAQDAGGGGGIE